MRSVPPAELMVATGRQPATACRVQLTAQGISGNLASMIFPMAERALRVAARRPAAYRMRVAVAGLGFLLSVWIVEGGRFTGPEAFRTLTWIAWGFALFAGAIFAADSISSEKREGTLGLLFLTDLKGSDIVLGKLLSCGLSCFFGLLALVPILGLPLLMGGVSFGQFWRVMLNLANTLLFSISVGLLSSALSRRSVWAATSALAVLGLAGFGLPLLAKVLSLNQHPVEWTQMVQLASPFFSQTQARLAFAPLDLFWLSSSIIFALSMLLLVVTCRIVPGIWRERPPSGGVARLKARWRSWRFGPARRREAYRRRLVDANPLYWLGAREQVSSPGFMLLTLGVAAAALAIGSSAGVNDWVGDPVSGLVFVWMWAGLLMHVLMCYKVASVAGRRLAQDRTSGALELLLVTPLTAGAILRGHWRALLRKLTGPAILVLLVHMVFIWGLAVFFVQEIERTFSAFQLLKAAWTGNTGGEDIDPHELEILRIISVAGLILAMNWIALGWAAMWLSLRSKAPRFVPWLALILVLIPPWALFYAVAGLISDFKPFLTFESFLHLRIHIAAVLVLAHALLLSVWAWWKLSRDFRRTALDPCQAPLGGRGGRLWILLRRGVVGSALAALLFSAFYNLEAWRGRRALHHLEQELAGAGQSLHPPAFASANQPGLGSIPLASFFGQTSSQQQEELKRLEAVNLQNLRHPDGTSRREVGIGDLRRQQSTDLFAWRDFVTGQTNSALTVAPVKAATDLLAALDKYANELDQLQQAAYLPEIQSPFAGAFSSMLMLPEEVERLRPLHLRIVSQLGSILRLRASAKVVLGQTGEAREDIDLLLRLASILRLEAPKVSQHLIWSALQPVWEGLADHRWTEPDLEWFSQRLAQFDLVEDCQTALWNETIRQIAGLGRFQKKRARADDQRPEPYSVGKAPRIYPSGWIYQGQVQLHRIYSEKAGPLVDPNTGQFFPGQWRELASSRGPLFNPWFGHSLHLMILEFARLQTGLIQARIACALERYRLAHGEYPLSLDALAPDWMDQVPHDPVGQPFRYRRFTPTLFEFYSTGWNQKDNGANIQIDWVWSRALSG